MTTVAGIPPHLVDALKRYIDHHIPPGDCLRAILSNDLRGALTWADPETVKALPSIVRWLHCAAFSACYGSPEKVNAWLTADVARDESETA